MSDSDETKKIVHLFGGPSDPDHSSNQHLFGGDSDSAERHGMMTGNEDAKINSIINFRPINRRPGVIVSFC